MQGHSSRKESNYKAEAVGIKGPGQAPSARSPQTEVGGDEDAVDLLNEDEEVADHGHDHDADDVDSGDQISKKTGGSRDCASGTGGKTAHGASSAGQRKRHNQIGSRAKSGKNLSNNMQDNQQVQMTKEISVRDIDQIRNNQHKVATADLHLTKMGNF